MELEPEIENPDFYIGRRVFIKDSGNTRQHTIAAYLDDHTAILTNSFGMISVAAIKLDRLDPVPQPERKTPSGYIGGSDFLCTADEATEWFVFVMLQAGLLFERTPDDAWEEVSRLLQVRGIEEGSPFYEGAKGYWFAIKAWYDRDRALDGED